jgi:hypothetical protein
MINADLKVVSVIHDKAEIIRLHNEICQYGKMTIDKAIRAGELLSEIKKSVGHGNWIPWVKENLPFNRQTAANYIRVFYGRDDLKCTTVVHLTGAYRVFSMLNEEAETATADATDATETTGVTTSANGELANPTAKEVEAKVIELELIHPRPTPDNPKPKQPKIEERDKFSEISWLVLTIESDMAVLALTPSNQDWQTSALAFFGSLRKRKIVTVS